MANAQQIKKLKKMVIDEKATAKKKLESLRKMMESKSANERKAAEKVIAKKIENKVKIASNKLKNQHKIEVAALKDEKDQLSARLAEIEAGNAARQEELKKEAERLKAEKLKKGASWAGPNSASSGRGG